VVNFIETYIGLIRIEVFLFVRLCLWVGGSRSFKGSWRHFLQWSSNPVLHCGLSKRREPLVKWHNFISKKTRILTNTAARTSNLACPVL